MDWNTRYSVSRALVLQIGENGEILARGTLSGGIERLDRGRLAVLLAFAGAGGRMPRRALAETGEVSEPAGPGLDEVGFAAAAAELIERRLLIPAAGGPQPAPRAGSGFATATTHYPLIRDTVRVMSYRQAIARRCRDRTVVDLGCGSGLLSILAARAGARRVIAIEESAIAELAAEMFRANGVADRIELVRGNSRDVTLDEPAEVVVHELLGADPFDEGLLPAIADARERLLAPGGRLIPHAIEVLCVGFEVAPAPRLDLGRAAHDLAELGALYGVDLGAFRSALEAEAAADVRPRLAPLDKARFERPILTDELELFRVDLRPGAPLALEPRELRLRARRAGDLGGVLVYFRAHLDDDVVLGNAPWGPATSWQWSPRPLARLIAVEPGREIPIRAEVRTAYGIEGVHVELA